MKKYEIMYILRPNLDNNEVKKINDHLESVFSKKPSTILEKKEIGLKDLAYPINNHKKGYYYWFITQTDNEAVLEFNRIVKITEEVIRFIIIKE
ncbi:30S ribosomal protein S6 [Candidatus Phytoplasma australiense]|uniref:Small ribosomal subunit protein bS6 n=2 Tax=Phytoplasma australiense TaxID=59748 RepID=RS6_PHYAS|nr:30S ribosomal protein S6 [Candidatus Phytoplasma australiense]B1V955.1 RecName: Full=Small ribosomal subunit protein bS6; AltName: Full=30S ribosomal protein S6 [Candidatus Phytoplasma australiense]AGL90807.1 30S ribosomal protein S6 [Strawberry lethal yellows phytoplasma (CPA) str. NZSb11]CAM11487.1 30S ribosomal protein S6 [Candidatus Phytoplasma australiense]